MADESPPPAMVGRCRAAGVCVQFAGIFASYAVTQPAARTLAGEQVYLYGDWSARVAYGDDGPRWVPQASPLLFQLELTAAYLKEKLTGTGFVVTYNPYRGNKETINLTHPDSSFGVPDFWWTSAAETTKQHLVAALLAMLWLGCSLPIAREFLARPSTSVRAWA